MKNTLDTVLPLVVVAAGPVGVRLSSLLAGEVEWNDFTAGQALPQGIMTRIDTTHTTRK